MARKIYKRSKYGGHEYKYDVQKIASYLATVREIDTKQREGGKQIKILNIYVNPETNAREYEKGKLTVSKDDIRKSKGAFPFYNPEKALWYKYEESGKLVYDKPIKEAKKGTLVKEEKNPNKVEQPLHAELTRRRKKHNIRIKRRKRGGIPHKKKGIQVRR